jgi:peptide/nickel transport system permease protein
MTALRRRLGATGMVALAFLLLVAVLAIGGSRLAPHDPDLGDILNAYAPVGPAHWLGTDINGRDTASRLIAGARTSLLGPAGVVLLSLVLGMPLALIAAWRGGTVDAIVSRVLDVIFALPGILLAILAVAVFGPGLVPAMLAIAVSYLPYVARIVRSAALQHRVRPYVTALEVQGASAFTICVRHILPNIAGLVLAQSTLAFGYALADLAALSFLGLAVQAPQADWGVLVNDQAGLQNGHAVQVVAASILISATIVALTLLGDRLAGNDEPRLQRRWRRRTNGTSAPTVAAPIAERLPVAEAAG